MESAHLDTVTGIDGEEVGAHGLTWAVESVKVVGVGAHASLVQAVDGESQLAAAGVDGTLAGELDVLGLVCLDEREAQIVPLLRVAAVGALLGDVDVVIGIGTAQEGGAALEVELDIGTQLEGTDDIVAGLEDDGAAALTTQVVDGALDGGSVDGLTVGYEFDTRRAHGLGSFGHSGNEHHGCHEDIVTVFHNVCYGQRLPDDSCGCY